MIETFVAAAAILTGVGIVLFGVPAIASARRRRERDRQLDEMERAYGVKEPEHAEEV